MAYRWVIIYLFTLPNLWLLIGLFKPFTLKLIVDMLGPMLAIYFILFSICFLFLFFHSYLSIGYLNLFKKFNIDLFIVFLSI